MNEIGSIGKKGSLLERASDAWNFETTLRGDGVPPVHYPADAPEARAPAMAAALHGAEGDAPMPLPQGFNSAVRPVDRAALTAAGFILPDSPASTMSEEFRLVKRHLLANATGGKGAEKLARGERILIASPQPGDGKSFCAVNLALSMAAEQDVEILLIDADFARPGIPALLGLPDGPGLMDALSDRTVAVEDCVIRTDIPKLSVLPAGRRTNKDTEYLASARTGRVLDALTAHNPARILIFDSPPVLAASLAAALAAHVGQTVLVVRADRTSENALREAVGLLSGCAHIRLLLNAARFSGGARRFGHYHGGGE